MKTKKFKSLATESRSNKLGQSSENTLTSSNPKFLNIHHLRKKRKVSLTGEINQMDA
jgi:hypothetical protein